MFTPDTGTGLLRIASARVPDGVVAEAWIAETFMDCLAACQATLVEVVIAGQPAKLRDTGEAVLIVDDLAYVLTLFPGGSDGLSEARTWFDAFMATLELHPEAAAGSPSPAPSSS